LKRSSNNLSKGSAHKYEGTFQKEHKTMNGKGMKNKVLVMGAYIYYLKRIKAIKWLKTQA
jgi:hypothetical protein